MVAVKPTRKKNGQLELPKKPLEIVKLAEAMGWTVEERTLKWIISNPHQTGPNSQVVVQRHTPSNIGRDLANLHRDLNRAGFTAAYQAYLIDQEEARQAALDAARQKADADMARAAATTPMFRPPTAAKSTPPAGKLPNPFDVPDFLGRYLSSPPGTVWMDGQPFAKLETLTSDHAAVILDICNPDRPDHNPPVLEDGTVLSQRSRKPGWTGRLREMMGNGEWDPYTHQSIALTADRYLVDGQHRVNAAFEHICNGGDPVQMMVTYNARPDSFKNVDRGVNRTGADILKIAGYTDTNKLASALKVVFMYAKYMSDPNGTMAMWTEWPRKDMTTPMLIDYVKENPEVVEYLRISRAYIGEPTRYNHAALIAFLWAVNRAAGPDGCMNEAHEFLSAMRTGRDLTTTQNRFRNWIVANRGRNLDRFHGARREATLFFLLRVWELTHDPKAGAREQVRILADMRMPFPYQINAEAVSG